MARFSLWSPLGRSSAEAHAVMSEGGRCCRPHAHILTIPRRSLGRARAKGARGTAADLRPRQYLRVRFTI